MAIIPARGGSKGIPRKNLADLCGRPLIAWSIETGNALVSMGVITRCIVSTDDPEIAEVARQYRGDLPFMRPAEISGDTANAVSYVIHALDALLKEGQNFDAVMLLQPTCPVRDTAAIAEAVARFRRGGSDSLVSCYEENYVNDLVTYQIDGDGFLKPKVDGHNQGVRRQDHGPTMIRNGALYITRTDYIRRAGHVISERPMSLIMRKVDSTNIDTPDDLKILRALLCG